MMATIEAKATERQKQRMRELGISFDETMTLAEAAELIRVDTNKRPAPAPRTKSCLGESALVENSDWED